MWTVKHILVLTQDEEGNALDDAAKEEKLAQARACSSSCGRSPAARRSWSFSTS